MVWGVFTMDVGLWVAARMVWPDATFGQDWSGYGRLHLVPKPNGMPISGW